MTSSSGSLLYAACGTGIFKSADWGATWNAASAGLGTSPASALAVDPILPDTLYAAQALCIRGCVHTGMFRSRDGGDTWTAIGSGLDLGLGGVVGSFAFDPAAPGTMYAGAGAAGVLRSTDGGDSWAPANAGLPRSTPVATLALAPTTPATLYAGTSGDGLYESTDGGGAWTAIGGLAAPYIRAIAIHPALPTTLYVIIDAPTPDRIPGLARSTNGGASWADTALAGVDVGAVVVDATGTVYASTFLMGVARSTDGGDAWRALATGLGAPDVGYPYVELALDPASGRLFAANYSGVFAIDQIPACAGDCNVDDDVAIGELVMLVSIGLGDDSVVDCGSGDTNGDGRITIDEVIQAVNVALDGCAVAEEQP